jgi:pimeloyl-ACP methyl ester carboxylesterase
MTNPEIGKSVIANGISTNYIEAGDTANSPLILIHGSGPGVTAFANWNGVIPALAEHFHIYAPDMVGFGYTDCPTELDDINMDVWVSHIAAFMDVLGIASARFIGNSFGGALTLALAARQPDKVEQIVLMGAAGLPFPITDGLRKVWGYQPSALAMRDLMETFAHNAELVTDVIVESRYQASIRPGAQEAFARLFPEPRQARLDALCTPQEALRALTQPTLIMHGREDVIVPLSVSQQYNTLIPNSELHVFGHCGHWTQIEKKDRFLQLVIPFFKQ